MQRYQLSEKLSSKDIIVPIKLSLKDKINLRRHNNSLRVADTEPDSAMSRNLDGMSQLLQPNGAQSHRASLQDNYNYPEQDLRAQ